MLNKRKSVSPQSGTAGNKGELYLRLWEKAEQRPAGVLPPARRPDIERHAHVASSLAQTQHQRLVRL
jgi:hypothetical protein